MNDRARVDEIKRVLDDPEKVCRALGLEEGAQRQSRGLLVRCPGHDDSKPSNSVIRGPDGTLQCSCKAGCGVQGDVFDLIAAVMRVDRRRDFPRVLEEAGKLAGLDPRAPSPQPRPAPVPPAKPGDKGKRPKEDPADVWSALPPLDADCWEYLRSRGLAEAAARCKSTTPATPGIAGWHAKNGHRLAVPLRDPSGRVVAIQLRAIDGRTGNDRFRSIGPTGAGVFGDPAAVAKAQVVVLCEGLTDSLAASLFVRPGWCTIGIAGVEHAQGVLRKFRFRGKRVIVATDADEAKPDGTPGAGDRCAAALAELVTADGGTCLRARPTQGKDLCAFVAAGGDLGSLFDGAAPVVEEELPPLPPTVAEVLRSDAFKAPQKTYSTGYEQLDELLCGGVKARQATIFAAPTGAGKTGFVGGIALTLANAIPVLWVATEIDDPEQAARLAVIGTRKNPDDILALRDDPVGHAARVDGTRVYIFNLDVLESDEPFLEIRLRARSIKKSTGHYPAIIIDYIQQLASDDPDRHRVSVGTVANMLRRLARDLDVPVIGISSVSRAYYGAGKKTDDGEEDPRAWLAAAKESGDIEYAAAVFVYLDTSSTIDQLDESPARAIVAKSRRGRRGFVGFVFHGPSGTFRPSDGALASLGAHRSATEDDEKVLTFIATTRAQPLSVRDIRSSCGINGRRADESIARLRRTGKLLGREVRILGGGRGPRKRVWIILPSWAGDPLPIGFADAGSECASDPPKDAHAVA